MADRESATPERTVEIAFALPDEQAVVAVAWEPGMTAQMAIDRSGLSARFPQIDAAGVALGVHAVPIARAHVLRPGDRVDICRPLQADPRKMRLDLVADGKVMGARPAGDEP